MPSKRRIHALGARGLLFFAGLAVLSAATSCQSPPESVTIRAAGQDLRVEVARTEAQREHGLMGRKNLGPRDGMIFVFDRDQKLSFWMKDTPTPLSIAFLSAEGRILQIEDMEPFSEKVIQSRLSARYALEMRQGAFAALGVAEGTVVEFPAGFAE
jgi:uncharacterized protein